MRVVNHWIFESTDRIATVQATKNAHITVTVSGVAGNATVSIECRTSTACKTVSFDVEDLADMNGQISVRAALEWSFFTGVVSRLLMDMDGTTVNHRVVKHA